MTIKPRIFYPSVDPNEHLTKLLRHFGDIKPAPVEVNAGVRFLFQCFTNRSGSNYLAELLSSDGTLPMAGENLNYDTVINHSALNAFDSFQKYFSFLCTHTRHNNVVAIKVAPSHLALLGQSGILDQIIDRTTFTLIERSDKLSQAISHLIAFQTGKFMSSTTASQTQVEPVFDRAQLDKIIGNIAAEYHDFSLFFARNGLVPAHVVYEQMVEAPAATLAFVGSRIGFPELKILPEQVSLRRQTGQINHAWRQRYLAEAPLVDHER